MNIEHLLISADISIMEAIKRLDDATVKIYDVTGRVVLLKTYSSRIDVTGLEEGFYMVKIYHDNKMLFNNILVKIK